MAGYDIGVSTSASSGANISGATDQSGTYLGTSYGPGSLILLDQKGSIGAGGFGGGSNWLLWAGLAVAALVTFLIFKR